MTSSSSPRRSSWCRRRPRRWTPRTSRSVGHYRPGALRMPPRRHAVDLRDRVNPCYRFRAPFSLVRSAGRMRHQAQPAFHHLKAPGDPDRCAFILDRQQGKGQNKPPPWRSRSTGESGPLLAEIRRAYNPSGLPRTHPPSWLESPRTSGSWAVGIAGGVTK